MLALHPYQWSGDAQARRVGHAIAVLWVLAAADLLFTLWAHRFTPFVELNPLARALLTNDLPTSLVLFKLTLTALGTTIFWRLRHHGRAEAALWAMVAVYVALAVRWSEYTTEVLALA